MSNSIVTVNVTQTVAPTPSTLQGTGALISQGATTTAPGVSTELNQLSDLTSILRPAKAITSITWTANVATVTTTVAHGIANATEFEVTIAGATPAAYNGTFLATVTGASTFTYPLLSNPGGATSVPGTYIPASVAEVLSMATTFFAQGSGIGVYVLEEGLGQPSDGVSYLSTYLTDNPGTYYAIEVPRAWAAESTYLTLIGDYETTTSKLYFFTTATTGNYTSFTSLMKSAFVLVEAPNLPATEFSVSAAFWQFLANNPSPTSKVAPMAFRFLFGVTPYPTFGNQTLLAAIKAAGANYVATAAAGGISTAILWQGTTMDGRDASYWYSVDWLQINEDLAISNAIINGSNIKGNPLYYNQDGINRLQAVAAKTLSSGVSFGLVLGQVVTTALSQDDFNAALDAGTYDGQAVVNAVPFRSYTSANPSDYKIGKYGGLTVVYTPARGFTQIVFNINVTDFVSP